MFGLLYQQRRMGTSHSKHKQYYELHDRVHGYRKPSARSMSLNAVVINPSPIKNIDYIDRYKRDKRNVVVYQPNFDYDQLSTANVSPVTDSKTKIQTESTLPQAHGQYYSPRPIKTNAKLVSVPQADVSLQQIQVPSREVPALNTQNKFGGRESTETADKIKSTSTQTTVRKKDKQTRNMKQSKQHEQQKANKHKQYRNQQKSIHRQNPISSFRTNIVHFETDQRVNQLTRSRSIHAYEHGNQY